jgi:hypothetical protein
MSFSSAATVIAIVPLLTLSINEASNMLQPLLYLHEAFSGMIGFAFISGAMLYNIGFYKTRLIPRWLSVWGILALAMHLIQAILSLFGLESFSPLSIVLNVPIAVQEMVLAVWLIIFGFRKPQEV